MGAKGGQKTGGRVKGTPNKDKQELLNMILKTGCPHPIEGMATVAVRAREEGNTKLEQDAYRELAQYVAPKRKAVEVTGADGGPVEHSLDAGALSTEALKAILAANASD